MAKEECEQALGRDSPTSLKKEFPGALVTNTDSWALAPHQDFQEEKPGKLSPVPQGPYPRLGAVGGVSQLHRFRGSSDGEFCEL